MFSLKKTILVFCFLMLSLAILSSCASLPRNDETIVIPFTLVDNRMVIYATVNGIEGRFIWDTGSLFDSHTFIPLDNLPPVDPKKNRFPGRRYYIENGITINGQLIRSRSIITDFAAYDNGPHWEFVRQLLLNEGFDGMLGLAIFNGWWVEVSFSTSNIILHRTRPDGFVNFTPAFTTFQGLYSNGFFLVPVNVDGVPIWFILDTGAPEGFRFPHSVREKLDTDNYHKILTENDYFYEIRVSSIEIMHDAFVNRTIRTCSFATQFEFGLLGVEFLQHYDLLFDLRTISNEPERTRLYFRHRLGRSFRGIYTTGPESIFGIRFNLTEQGAVVDQVFSPSIAFDEFGIKPGMTIVSVNGQALTGKEMLQIYIILVEMAQSGVGELAIVDVDGTVRVIRRRVTEHDWWR